MIIILNFTFQNSTKLIFGKDTHREVGNNIKDLKLNNILLVYGSERIKSTTQYPEIMYSLSGAGLCIIELGGVKPNPKTDVVRKGIDICKEKQIDLVLAIGGGSVIDSAKAIAIGACTDIDIWDIFEKQIPAKSALPVATVLTLPAAGSESSPSAVLSNPENERKLGYSSQFIRPVFSIVNPEFFYTLPPYMMACGVADMISHIFERYFSNTTATDLTDQLCEATLRVIMKNALILKDDMKNYDAWCQVGFGGTVAHNDLLGMGREQDWACHGMEHELSAIYDVPHGAGLAVLTPGWMKYVYKTNPDVFVRFAINVMGVDKSFGDDDEIINEGIRRLIDFFDNLNLPSSLLELNIPQDKLELMAKKSTGFAYGFEYGLGGLLKLKWQDVLNIYKSVK